VIILEYWLQNKPSNNKFPIFAPAFGNVQLTMNN